MGPVVLIVIGVFILRQAEDGTRKRMAHYFPDTPESEIKWAVLVMKIIGIVAIVLGVSLLLP